MVLGDNEPIDLAIVKAKFRLEKVYQDHCVVVGVSALPFTVCVPPNPEEFHCAGTLPLWPEEEISTRAVKLLNYSLPGLLSGPDALWEGEDESHG